MRASRSNPLSNKDLSPISAAAHSRASSIATARFNLSLSVNSVETGLISSLTLFISALSAAGADGTVGICVSFGAGSGFAVVGAFTVVGGSLLSGTAVSAAIDFFSRMIQ